MLNARASRVEFLFHASRARDQIALQQRPRHRLPRPQALFVAADGADHRDIVLNF